MDKQNLKISIKLPEPKSTKNTKIKIGSSEFSINSPESVKRMNSDKSIEILEKALKEKVFSDLTHEQVNQ